LPEEPLSGAVVLVVVVGPFGNPLGRVVVVLDEVVLVPRKPPRRD
jgi:hypothetical protein